MSECSFEVGNLGRAVSPRSPTWANKFENLVQAFLERPPYLWFKRDASPQLRDALTRADALIFNY